MFRMLFGDCDPLGDRRNFQVGILARATSHRRTCWHEIKTQIPPSHSNALRISAWEEVEKINKFIKAVAKACSSAGKRLVVKRKSRVGINAWCNGKTRKRISDSRPLRGKGLRMVLLNNEFSETMIGINVTSQWARLYPWKDL